MKFVLNTRYPDSAAAHVCIGGLSKRLTRLGHTVVLGDWENYERYDVAIFMAAEADCKLVRSINPDILIGIADPKPSTQKQAKEADFCIVSSIEQREIFMHLNRNLFIYYMIPDFKWELVDHKEKEQYRIVYHGNKVHLNAAYQGLVPALNELGKKYPIQFDAIYNVKALGRWEMGRPDQRYCPTNDLQWYPNCYHHYLRNADIGVVQNIMPWRYEGLVRRLGRVSQTLLLEDRFDHQVKYKSSANAGRAFVFGYFGIPVVADAIPSTSDAIIDGKSGRLVLSADGWYDALEELILSADLRREMAGHFRQSITERFAPEVSATRLVKFLSDLRDRPTVNAKKVNPRVLRELWNVTKGRIGKKIMRISSRGTQS
jgi:glycosyltransferase involved in cell wall biosynthesis